MRAKGILLHFHFPLAILEFKKGEEKHREKFRP